MDIFVNPPTAEQIEALRAAVRRNDPIEDSYAFKVMMFCPIPIVDAIAGLATYAVESAIKPDPQKPFNYVPGSAARDWGSGPISSIYVAKVREQGRELMECEVKALENAASLETSTKVVVNAAASAVKGLFGSPEPKTP